MAKFKNKEKQKTIQRKQERKQKEIKLNPKMPKE